MGTLRFFEEVVSFKIRRTFGFADYIWGINNLVSALSAGAAGPIRCRAGFSRRRPEFGIVCYPCPRTFRHGKVRMNLSSLSVYPESLPCSLRQNANKFVFALGLFVSLT